MKRYLLIIPFLLFPFLANAAVSIDSTSTITKTGFQAGGFTATSSFTVGACSNELLVVSCNLWQDVAGAGTCGTGPSYNGTLLTKAVTSTRSVNMENEVWYEKSAPSGAHVVSSTVSGNTDAQKYQIVSLCGVDQTTPINSTGTFSATLTTSSVSLTPSFSTDYLIDFMNEFGTNAVTPGAAQTKIIGENAVSTAIGSSIFQATSTASFAMTWSWTGANDGEQIALSINAASTVSATPRRRSIIVNGN